MVNVGNNPIIGMFLSAGGKKGEFLIDKSNQTL